MFNQEGLSSEFRKPFRASSRRKKHDDASNASQGVCRARFHTAAQQREMENRKRRNLILTVHILRSRNPKKYTDTYPALNEVGLLNPIF